MAAGASSSTKNSMDVDVDVNGTVVGGEERCTVCVVKGFDARTGLYTVTCSNRKELLQLPFDKLLHFNHNDKSFHTGDTVFALVRSKQQRSLSTDFHRARVTRVSGVRCLLV